MLCVHRDPVIWGEDVRARRFRILDCGLSLVRLKNSNQRECSMGNSKQRQYVYHSYFRFRRLYRTQPKAWSPFGNGSRACIVGLDPVHEAVLHLMVK